MFLPIPISHLSAYLLTNQNILDVIMASLPSSSTAFTHLLALVAGIAIGKSIDADELTAYRSSTSDNIGTRIRRQMKSILVGSILVGLVIKTGSAAMRGLLGNGGEEGGRDDSERRAQ